MKIAIVIPARYASTRLPGKPLIKIAGQTMLHRVVQLSQQAVKGLQNVSVTVATDDVRIVSHCQDIEVPVILTSPALVTGTDRVADAVTQMAVKPDFIINMQGDAPLTPPDFLRAMIDSFVTTPCDAITPVTQLTWESLDQLRQQKLMTPFSGTTVTFNEKNGHAYWFSKTILPALREERVLRQQGLYSPIFRHIGLYGYSRHLLAEYAQLSPGYFERLEGLEQLRLLEHGYTIRCVPVDYQGRPNMTGVDSPEDVIRAAHFLEQQCAISEQGASS